MDKKHPLSRKINFPIIFSRLQDICVVTLESAGQDDVLYLLCLQIAIPHVTENIYRPYLICYLAERKNVSFFP